MTVRPFRSLTHAARWSTQLRRQLFYALFRIPQRTDAPWCLEFAGRSVDPSGAWTAGNAGYLSRLAARRRTLRHRPEATEMRFPDVTPGGGGGVADPATPVGKADGALALAHGDDPTVESVLQSLSPTSAKSVISRAAADAVAEVRPGFIVRSIPAVRSSSNPSIAA